uniref:Uncharacterized protein n=1 Tax=Arundo donax TaxID=35708 RepID=A0A0A9AD96_ARUDO
MPNDNAFCRSLCLDFRYRLQRSKLCDWKFSCVQIQSSFFPFLF